MRSLDDASVLDRYIAIKAKISELEEELEELKPEILNALMDEPKELADHKGFSFSIQRRKSYAYSPKVKELEDILKEAKAHERDQGIATIEKQKAILVMKAARKAG